MDGNDLSRYGQEKYAEMYGHLANLCLHCDDVERGEECCYCTDGFTDEIDAQVSRNDIIVRLPSEQ